MKKLNSNRGETLIETLAALLVATLVIGFLCTAVLVAARINSTIGDTDTAFRYTGESKTGALTVTVKDENNSTVGTFTTDEYADKSGQYKYYLPR